MWVMSCVHDFDMHACVILMCMCVLCYAGVCLDVCVCVHVRVMYACACVCGKYVLGVCDACTNASERDTGDTFFSNPALIL
jgi:hypothetical protein